MVKNYLKPEFNDDEIGDIKEMIGSYPSFYKNIWLQKIMLTDEITERLRNLMFGKIPRNFIINVRGLIGRKSGIFKTSMAMQLALELDSSFNIRERVGMTTYQLEEKIEKYGAKKQVFLLDEQIHDLKKGSEQRLANIAENCRENQICLIQCGVPEYFITYSDYYFERIGESSDDLLPKKTVYYAVRKLVEQRKSYRGIFRWNITPLSDKIWGNMWKKYMVLKQEHQDRVKKSQVTGFDFRKKARSIVLTDEFDMCIRKDKPVSRLVKNLVKRIIPDNTNEDRDSVYGEIMFNWKYIMEEKQNGNIPD